MFSESLCLKKQEGEQPVRTPSGLYTYTHGHTHPHTHACRLSIGATDYLIMFMLDEMQSSGPAPNTADLEEVQELGSLLAPNTAVNLKNLQSPGLLL